MKRYEKVALVLMVLGMALSMYLAMRSDAGTITEGVLWPLWAVAVPLLCGAITVAKRGWEKDTGKKAVLFFDLNGKEETK